MDIRDKIITGTFAIGSDGRKEPIDWRDYALKLEQYFEESGIITENELNDLAAQKDHYFSLISHIDQSKLP